MINGWVSIDIENTFADWSCEVSFKNRSEIKLFTNELLQVNLEKEVFYFKNNNLSFHESNKEYFNQVQEIDTERNHNLLLHYSGINFLKKTNFIPHTKIYFYNKDGGLTNEPIDSLNTILQNVNPKNVENSGYCENSFPVHFTSTPIKNNLKTVLQIRLQSNIFFPLIPNVFNLTKELYTGEKFIDNSELAGRNIAHFNSWFGEVIKIVDRFGGCFKLQPSYSFIKNYRMFLSDTGLNS